MHFSFLVYFNNLSTACFEYSNYSSSGEQLLHMQHMVFTVLEILKLCKTTYICTHIYVYIYKYI